ncbi:hypothetical protein Tco_1117561, partial [Tanacetum coccineum]
LILIVPIFDAWLLVMVDWLWVISNSCWVAIGEMRECCCSSSLCSLSMMFGSVTIAADLDPYSRQGFNDVCAHDVLNIGCCCSLDGRPLGTRLWLHVSVHGTWVMGNLCTCTLKPCSIVCRLQVMMEGWPSLLERARSILLVAKAIWKLLLKYPAWKCLFSKAKS